MQIRRKSRCSLKELFTAFLFFRNKETNIAQDPKGENIVSYLKEQLRFKSSLPVNQRIDELVKLGYVEKYCYNGEKLFSVKLLKIEWQEPELPIKKLKPEPVKKEKLIKVKKTIEQITEPNAPAPVVPVIAPAVQEKRFAILIDYENLKKHVNTAKLLDFSWLFDPILAKGKIVGGYVFFPEHYGNNMPVKTLSNIHRLFCVVCPKNLDSDGAFKDRDIVDSRMDELGRFLVEHSDITDLVIVSGDADFQGLVQFARWQQKEVKLVSTADAISSRFRLDQKLEKQLV